MPKRPETTQWNCTVYPCKHIMLTSAAWLTILTGCTTTGAAQYDPPAQATGPGTVRQASAPASERSILIFRQLVLDNALARGDGDAMIVAANSLLGTGESSKARRHPEGSPSSILDAAVWLLAHDRQEDGCSLAEKAVAAFPDNLPLTVLVSDLRLQQSRRGEALELVNAFLARHPENNEAKAEKGLILLRLGREKDALSAFSQIPDRELTPPMRLAYAQVLLVAKNYSSAEIQLKKASLENPDFLEARQMLAATLEEQGKKEEAGDLYAKLLAENPDNQSARLFYLRSLVKNSEWEKAGDIFIAAPDPGRLSVSLIGLFLDEKDPGTVENFLARLEKRSDLPPSASYYHAAFLVEKGNDEDGALKLLEKVPPSDPEYENALRLKIRICSDRNDDAGVLGTIEIIRKLHPGDAEPDIYTAEILFRQKNYRGARTFLKEAVSRHPDNAHLAFQSAYLYELEGDHAAALEHMEDVVRKHPDNAPALNFVGYSLADENRDLDRAHAMLDKAVRIAPDTDFILDSLAWVLYRLGRYDEAWNTMEKALSLAGDAPADPAMLEHSGDIALARKDPDAARAAWKKALGQLGPSEDAEMAKRLKNKLEAL